MAKFWSFLNTSIKVVAYLMHHLACHQWSKLQTKLATLGYSRKNPNRGLRIYFSENSPAIFRLVTLPWEIPKKTSSPLDILQNCMTPFENFKVKNQDPWRFFLVQLWKFHFVFSWLLEFTHALSSIPLEIACPQFLSLFGFSLEFWGVLAKDQHQNSLKWQFLLVQF